MSRLVRWTDADLAAKIAIEQRQFRARSAKRTYAQQLDFENRLHDIAPQTRQERLFTPAPTQLDGQTWLAVEAAPTPATKEPQ
jgi:hypothetical protein